MKASHYPAAGPFARSRTFPSLPRPRRAPAFPLVDEVQTTALEKKNALGVRKISGAQRQVTEVMQALSGG